MGKKNRRNRYSYSTQKRVNYSNTSSIAYRQEYQYRNLNKSLKRHLNQDSTYRKFLRVKGYLVNTLALANNPLRSNRTILSVLRRMKRRRDWVTDPTKRLRICLKRSIRRQILHALEKTGKGSGGGRKKWTRESFTKC